MSSDANHIVYANWHDALKDAVRDPAELLRRLQLPDNLLTAAKAAAETFGLLVPPAYLGRIRRGDPSDPLLRQVLPLSEELIKAPGFVLDPTRDQDFRNSPGLLRKYRGRALLIATGACAIHCRYCFRRHYAYAEEPHTIAQWRPALEAIAADASLHEVILSGGDPLMLVDERLSALIEAIARARHVKRLRIHTRLPIMIPERVTPNFLATLRAFRRSRAGRSVVLVLHANHAAEIDRQVAKATRRLANARVVLLNQSVLLRGVNDSVPALAALSQRLIAAGVVPYYLHQLDRVAGAAHFEVPREEGKALIAKLRETVSGYLSPRYVEERPGAECKEEI